MGSTRSKPSFKYTAAVDAGAPGESPVYGYPEPGPDVSYKCFGGATTLYESFKASVERHSSKSFLGTRVRNPDGTIGDYQWKTYGEISQFGLSLGYGYHSLGITSKDEDGNSFLGIYSRNREEWVINDIACMSQSIASVPLYDTLQGDSLDFILGQTNMKAVSCPLKQAESIIKFRKQGLIQNLQIVAVFEEISEELRAEAAGLGLAFYSLSEIARLAPDGQEHPPTADSLYTICYTSGTTGRPKGALITHNNLISTISGVINWGITFTPDETYLSYLPLAHMLERFVVNYLIAMGCSIGFSQGDVMKLKEDLAALRPTIFVSVPRLWNRFYDTIRQQFNALPPAKKVLVDRALKVKKHYWETQGKLTNFVWDKIVFGKVAQVLGGRVKLMATGSAPIAPDVLNFLRIVFSCPILEAYGQTETCAGSFITRHQDSETGHVGGPITTMQIKLVDVPEMEYLSTDRNEEGELTPRGEICLKGAPIFVGYYKSPELTAEALDADGWLHTGDIGLRLPHSGAIKLIDRKKNFFKLAQGEYVSAEKIELAYSKSHYVNQIFVYGDSLQATLIAIVVPDEHYIRKEWATNNGFAPEATFAEICASPQLKADILKDMDKYGKEAGLFGYEQVKAIALEPVAWTTDDLLTPTQKLMRFQAKKKYVDVIAQLYSGQ